MKLLGKILLVCAIISLAAFWFVIFGRKTSSTLEFRISKGQSLISISQQLFDTKITLHPRLFWIYVLLTEGQSLVRAGDFEIPKGANIPAIYQILTTGGRDDVTLTITPGTRVEEITDLPPEYRLKLADKIGYLLPETYLIPRSFNLTQISQLLIQEFQNKLDTITANSTTNLTTGESIIVASLLEREAKTLPDKKIVAGIIQNRLALGMPLQIDATVQFARDTAYPPRVGDYWRPITKSQLKTESPFNTYLNLGLPPTAICNSGIDSLTAAFHPTATDFLFYISDNQGFLHFAETLDEHNNNIAKYLK